MRAAWFGIVLLSLLFSASVAVASPQASGVHPTAMVTATYTLYGNATAGWGFSTGSISEPGPSLTASVGENVTLRLFSDDRATHNWFLALDGGTGPSAGEPSSPDFNSSSTPVLYSFTVPNRVGIFTYRCRIHPTLMTGSFVIIAAPNVALYGSATLGWGLSAAGVTNPGPTLAATQGQPFEVALYAVDNVTHQFFVSYDGSQAPSSGEPTSANFSSSQVPVFLAFTPTSSGNFTYYCRYHPGVMKGRIEIASAGGVSSPPSYTVYAAVIVVVAIAAIAAAVVIRMRPRQPPNQPPLRPPGQA